MELKEKMHKVKIEDLVPYSQNPKEHPSSQIDKIASSIKKFGFKVPMLITEDHEIIAGHGRLQACRKLGLEEVPAIIVDDLTEAEIKAFRLADNRTTESEWDDELLSVELEELDESDFDLELTGFDEEELSPLLDEQKEAEEDEFEEPDEIDSRCEKDQVWRLGDHRLMCGDATSEEDVDMLMCGEKAELLFTSPPYVDMRTYKGNKDLSVDKISDFIPTLSTYTNFICLNLGVKYKDNEVFTYWDDYIEKAKDQGLKLLSWNIWNRKEPRTIGQRTQMFGLCHEWIFVFGSKKKELNNMVPNKHGGETTISHTRQKDGSTKKESYEVQEFRPPSTVLTSEVSHNTEITSKHPATFPIEFPSEYIKAMTDKKDIVIDCFAGSGTVGIACEQLGRRCYMMEIDPEYCEVIMQRWEELTGQKAELS